MTTLTNRPPIFTKFGYELHVIDGKAWVGDNAGAKA